MHKHNEYKLSGKVIDKQYEHITNRILASQLKSSSYAAGAMVPGTMIQTSSLLEVAYIVIYTSDLISCK